ncbi:response regulator transcription factor [Vallitalea maricola]|uniref:Uncharacterized protein n=1 Tax=Vallitalea maricola TaxID=3074433 RepID=A0ACB5UKM5_9FIRM|nr:hypothetical protein AN2V17_24050 [Vallitalea sp. AN17-2]
MYRILIVDDESDERQVIRFLLDRYNFDLNILEASNGKEALTKLKDCPSDILFTDVKMPFMDGIKLASSAKELFPNIQIIFFSGHDDFEYIKKALSLRAVDYILKPINPCEFQKTISLVLQRTEQLQKEIADKKKHDLYLKNHILYRLINKTCLETLIKEYPTINLSYLMDYSRLFLLEFDEPLFDNLQSEGFHSYNDKIHRIIDMHFDFINLNPFQSLLLFKSKNKPPIYYRELAIKIQNYISTIYERKCFISISNEITQPNDISKAYEEAEGYLENRFFFSDTYVYSIETSFINNEHNSEQDNYLLQAIQKDIQLKDIYSLKQDINTMFQKYRNKQSLSHIYIRFLCSNLLQILYKELPEYKESEFTKNITNIYSSHSFEEIQEFLYDILDKVIEKFETEQLSPKHAIHLIKQYIHTHYGENLNLNVLADKVFLTPRYLSTLFIQEIGYGINRYIKNLRMDKAKELLINTNIKITDICKTVGYSNVSYFCKSFQENFGITPEKYRQKHI